MRVFLLAVAVLLTTQMAFAGHHEEKLKLAKRQADAMMTVTSVNLANHLQLSQLPVIWVYMGRSIRPTSLAAALPALAER